MTHIQTIALLSLMLSAALLYYLGYYFGRKDGRETGLAIGRKRGRESAQIRVRELEQNLHDAYRQYGRLERQFRLANANAKLGAAERQTLLQIAGKLQVSAATFGAINAKVHSEQTLQLRAKALALAELVQPVEQERAA